MESADQFLARYYATISKARSLKETNPFFARNPKRDKMMKEMEDPKNASLEKFIISSYKTEPSKVQIVSRKEEGGKFKYELKAAVIPDEFKESSKDPSFYMKGWATVIREDNDWKIYTDFWEVKSKAKLGVTMTGFGLDPDHEHRNDLAAEKTERQLSAPPLPAAQTFDSQLRDKLLEKWDDPGPGKVHLSFKILPDGRLDKIRVKEDLGRKEPEAYARSRVQAFRSEPLPSKYMSTPYVRMSIDWKKNCRSVSGPYFESSIPD